MRKGRDKNIPVISEHIRKRNEARSISARKNCRLPAYGLPSYLPITSVSEDDASITKHKSYMNLELKKRNVDMMKINCSMTATFNDRRSLVVEKEVPLSTLLEEYPALKDCQQVRNVLNLLSRCSQWK